MFPVGEHVVSVRILWGNFGVHRLKYRAMLISVCEGMREKINQIGDFSALYKFTAFFILPKIPSAIFVSRKEKPFGKPRGFAFLIFQNRLFEQI